MKEIKTITIIGAGLMVKPMVDYFIEKNGYRIFLVDQYIEKAKNIKANRPECIAYEWKNNDTKQLDNVIEQSDLVISMVPKPVHLIIAKSCLKFKVNMVTASYEIPALMDLKDEVEKQGILILNELGEVPGMDHFGTQMLLDQIKKENGRVLSINSYGSGIPSFRSNNNPMGYKFSWDPSTVFVAAQTAAAYFKDGKKIHIPGDKLFENFWYVEIDDLGIFETYPNKDVEKYIEPFGLDKNISFYRGLLRYSGYCNNMRYLKELGLFENEKSNNFKNKTFLQFTSSLIDRASGENIQKHVANYLKLDVNSDFIHRIKWLGFFDSEPIPLDDGTNLDVLLNRMLEKMAYAPGEIDMIILHIEIIAEFNGGIKEKRIATMIVRGDPTGETAMSRAVALPTAISSRLIVDEKIKAIGLRMPPNLPELYRPVLDELKEHGYEFTTKRIRL
ncbi:MAG: saccharopine dehydrogenase C-terminal domain-containing protein [Bacteroidota bacterium]|nr:saccharopine dehydrogenase C-terminal domain-containing protein [Bacteroidota bacterium]